MSGSAAEERIRAKAEAMLRGAFDDARIVHELVLRQGGVRIDLAAVTPDRLICVEIKSERDILARLPDQVAAMRRVADAWCVVTVPKHLDKCRDVAGLLNVLVENELGRNRLWRASLAGLCNAPARLDMLWADELRRIAGHVGSRQPCIIAATDSLTGAQVRRAVCRELRGRPFPRSDAPMLAPPWAGP